MVQGFSDYLEQFQDKLDDKFESFTSILLPVTVKTDFEQFLLACQGTGLQITFSTLFSPDRSFKPEEDRLLVKTMKLWRGSSKTSSIGVLSVNSGGQ